MTERRLTELETAFAVAPEPWRTFGLEALAAARDGWRQATDRDADVGDLRRLSAADTPLASELQ